MSKKKIIRKSKNTLNIFANGGEILSTVAPAAGSIIGSGIANVQIADTGSIEDTIKGAQTYVVGASNNNELMGEWSAYTPVKNVSWKDIRGGNTGSRITSTIGSIGSGISAGAGIGGPVGGVIGGIAGLGSAIGGWIAGNRKAKRKARRLNDQINRANAKNLVALEDRASDIDTQNDLVSMAGFMAYGGPLDLVGSEAIDYSLSLEELRNKELDAMSKYRLTALPNYTSVPELNVFAKGGGIHIKKKNRGKFTEYCGGKITNECIQRGLHSSNPTTRKRANFARNARKWHHDLGGYLFDEGGNLYTNIPNIGQHGGDFSNGVTVIRSGGSHEENPNEGIIMGIAPDGNPNLVEEDEVKFNDYIFSNRLFADKDLLSTYNLPNSYNNHSFADIAERLSKESSERPNDPISKRGLMSSMTRLQQAQEAIREAENTNTYAKGGHLFASGGDTDDTENDPVTDTAPTTASTGRGKSFNPDLTWLRYAPVLGSTIGALGDLTGLTNKPDYSNADLVGGTVDNLPEISFNPLGNYLSYNPLDRNYYINGLDAQAGATRRAITNQSGGNRAAAMAGLLAADYNAQGRLGDLARQAEEYNMAQRERVEAFNRGTNQFNTEMGLRAAMANQRNDELRFKGRMAQAQMRDQVNARTSAARSANLTNFFDNLGEVGREEFARNMVNENPATRYSISRKGSTDYKKKSAKGGYLTIKNKKK